MYQHVVEAPPVGSFRARALVGSRSIMLAWNHVGPAAERADLLGFAVHRTDLTDPANDTWLQGQKRFAFQVNQGPNFPSNVAPFQRFRWGDYGAFPGHHYKYEIHPVRGTPANPDPQTPLVLDLEAAKHLVGNLGVYSNRGVTASLAYNGKYGKPPQKLPQPKQDEAYAWLTRDLGPALLDFIDATVAGDELRVAIFEFEDEDIRDRLVAASDRGVTVRIVYHDRAGTHEAEENTGNLEPLIGKAELIPRKKVDKISHNKFMVHLVPGAGGAAPKATRVWTGSTNFTRAGLYLQTNLGLLFQSDKVAQGFADYWTILSGDPVAAVAKAADKALIDAVRATLPNGPQVYFSPVAGKELLDTAVGLVQQASSLVLVSAPFGLDVQVRDAINANPQGVVEYGLVNATSTVLIGQLPHDLSKFSWFTTPAWLPSIDGRRWDNQPFGNHKIHTKSIVIDPFSQHPQMLVGSANFSDESVNHNDENAFLFVDELRGSAIVATEFLRMFDHYKTRAFIKTLEAAPHEQFLKEDGSWAGDYYNPALSRARERQVFAGEV